MLYDCGYAIRIYTTDDNGNITTDGNFTHRYQDAYFDPYEENKIIVCNTPIDITDGNFKTNNTLSSRHRILHPDTNTHHHNHGDFDVPEYTNVQILSGEGLTIQELFVKYTSDTYEYMNGSDGTKIQYISYINANDGRERKGIVFVCNEATPRTKTVTSTKQVLTGYKCDCGETKKA